MAFQITGGQTAHVPPLGAGTLFGSMGPLSAPMSVTQSSNTTASGKRKGWPLKHCRRAYFYRRPVMRMYYTIQSIIDNDKVNPILSEEEVSEFKKIKSKLAKLYNNRFEEYYKMMCDERGVEYHPRGIVNKFILAE